MKRSIRAALAMMTGMVAILGVGDAFAQPANTVDSHLAAAKAAAQFDFTGTATGGT